MEGLYIRSEWLQVKAFSFLIGKFRLDVWWFGLLLLLEPKRKCSQLVAF